MLRLIRTDNDHPGFPTLVQELDDFLTDKNGDQNEFFQQFNHLQPLRNVVLAEFEGVAVGCGAFKVLEAGTVEIKRMFVRPDVRGQRVGAQILGELEVWAFELGYKRAVLETLKTLSNARRLYERSGYEIIENYEPYVGVESSVCMAKRL